MGALTWWHYLKSVKLAALCNLHLHMLAQQLLDSHGKGVAGIARIGEYHLNCTQRSLAALKRLQSTLAICHIGCRHRNGMSQAKCVHRNMALDARDFLARVIALKARSVRVFDALRINNHERARFAAPLSASGHANLIF